MTLGSDGARDNAPAQTNAATQKVAQKWLGDPKNATAASNMLSAGQAHRSGLGRQLLDAGASAVKRDGGVGSQTTAPAVASFIQNSMKLPDVLPKPKPTVVKMMRRQ